MNKLQHMVADFHRRYGQPAPDHLTREAIRPELRIRLILEEAVELAQALGTTGVYAHVNAYEFEHANCDAEVPPGEIDLVKAADAVADLLYVVLGTAVELGLDVEPVFKEVHRSNMTKTPNTDPGGKILKGPDYSPPQIATVLANLMAVPGECLDE